MIYSYIFYMKRFFEIIFICLITIFSFYYTNSVIDFIKDEDPIMKKIKAYKSNKKMINGVLTKDVMLVGSSGNTIDVDKSYEKMKSIKNFNKDLLEYNIVKPEITKKNNLDKLIVGKNTKNKEISFIFLIDNFEIFKEISYITEINKVNVTFFIFSNILNNYKKEIVKYINNNSIGFMNDIDNKIIVRKYFENNIANYCLYKDDSFLEVCKLNRINTVNPIVIKNNLYSYLKLYKENGYIYLISSNKNNIKQLNSSFIYLKQKGYKIMNIDDLLKE